MWNSESDVDENKIRASSFKSVYEQRLQEVRCETEKMNVSSIEEIVSKTLDQVIWFFDGTRGIHNGLSEETVLFLDQTRIPNDQKVRLLTRARVISSTSPYHDNCAARGKYFLAYIDALYTILEERAQEREDREAKKKNA